MELRDERGSAIPEFALVLPLLGFLLFGMIEFGLLMFNKQVITNASREAARAGILIDPPVPAESNYEAWVKGIASSYCSDYLITFSTTGSPAIDLTFPADPAFGDELKVEVTYTYSFLIFDALAGLFGGGTDWDTTDLYARTVMRYE
ncbi:MAG: TadE/TadG family type IV pilus assembly protein [Desulfobacterales bacterium]|jgi:Flp pilus assembly protein TadG